MVVMDVLYAELLQFGAQSDGIVGPVKVFGVTCCRVEPLQSQHMLGQGDEGEGVGPRGEPLGQFVYMAQCAAP